MSLKSALRKICWTLHLDLTQNMRYDRMTRRAFQHFLAQDSIAVDVGCHKGEVLEWMLELAPKGVHWAFEPIPELAAKLRDKFGNQVQLHELALSNQQGKSKFQWVRNAPAYSGLMRRNYDGIEPEVEEIWVQTCTLDQVFTGEKLDLIKIDVEGGELQVLQGAVETVARFRPVLVFEFGLGASEHYGTTPEQMWNLLHHQWNYRVLTLMDFDSGRRAAMTFQQLEAHFKERTEYYFIALPE
jgi:FkbM family methyltransferase